MIREFIWAWTHLSLAELAMVIMFIIFGLGNWLFVLLWGLSHKKANRFYNENLQLKRVVQQLEAKVGSNDSNTAA